MYIYLSTRIYTCVLPPCAITLLNEALPLKLKPKMTKNEYIYTSQVYKKGEERKYVLSQ